MLLATIPPTFAAAMKTYSVFCSEETVDKLLFGKVELIDGSHEVLIAFRPRSLVIAEPPAGMPCDIDL